MCKLQKYGVRGIPLSWFASYLTNRQQYAGIDGMESLKQTIKCGIPRGSSFGPLLFLLYINDIPNCSDKLSFRIFADDTNIFASSSNAVELQSLINQELSKVKEWCDLNKLSINLTKTNYMIIKSPKRKTNIIWDVKLTNNDGSAYSLEKRTYIKYLGVLIDDTLSWKHQVSYLCTRIFRNRGIIGKLRYFTSLSQLKQLYYNLIYPYISYAITSWGSAFTTQIKKVQTKQNHVIRLMFFATLYGPDTDSALPLLNLLDKLTGKNIYKLKLLNFTHQWHF